MISFFFFPHSPGLPQWKLFRGFSFS